MKRFFTYFILLNTMIPISLIVTLELVKAAMGYFLEKDREMFIKKTRPGKNGEMENYM